MFTLLEMLVPMILTFRINIQYVLQLPGSQNATHGPSFFAQLSTVIFQKYTNTTSKYVYVCTFCSGEITGCRQFTSLNHE